MRLLRQADIEAALPMREAIPLMGAAFQAISLSSAQAAERQVLNLNSGHGLLMGASAPGQGIVAKLVSVIPANRTKGLPVSSGLAVLVNEQDGRALALFDATALTAWRTAAAVGFATNLLARPDASFGLLIGSGTQARAQLLAMDAVRPLQEIRIMARNERRIQDLIARVQSEVRAKLVHFGSSESERKAALIETNLITAATTSDIPVVPGREISSGCHVNGIGSFRPGMREFDQDLIERARIYVESRATASAEAGELIAGVEAGNTTVQAWRQIGEVLDGTSPGRVGPDEITFYKSVGHAVFDLFAASAIYRQAETRDLGTEWAL